MKEETGKWVGLAEDNLKAADALLMSGFHRLCIFQCQQAIELLLKAIWVERSTEGYPPRQHNLVTLAQTADVDLDEGHQQFLDDLSRQYIPSRYADAAVEYSRERAEYFHSSTREVFAWLRQQLN